MMYDVAIIGLGPAGIEFAKESLKRGLKTIAFERSSLGGTCLNVGCIPTKTMISCAEVFSKMCNSKKYAIDCSSSFSYKDICDKRDKIVSKLSGAVEKDLLSKGLQIIFSDISLKIENNKPIIVSQDNQYTADKIIVATGSTPIFPKFPCDCDVLLSSDDLLKLDNLPKNILIMGSGAIGVEWARILKTLGSNVCVVEKASHAAPACDIEVSARIERIFKISKINFYKNSYVVSHDNGCATLSNGENIQCDKILCAIGRKPALPAFLDNFQLEIFPECKTNVPNLFVVGDASGSKMLAHAASHQARTLFKTLFDNAKYQISHIPSVIYGTPEIASIGINEQDIKNLQDYKIFKLPISFLPKSWCDDEIDGFIKIITKNGLIEGAHIVSKEASALISEIAIAMKANMNINELKDVIFPHPTYSEGIWEAINNG